MAMVLIETRRCIFTGQKSAISAMGESVSDRETVEWEQSLSQLTKFVVLSKLSGIHREKVA